jgi:PST family polysaccharide transporter
VEGKLRAWEVKLGRVRGLVLDSWPLLLSGLAITFYMSIDQVMLGKMVGDGGVGVYSAAVRVSEVWYFLPVAVTASVFPALIRAKQKSPAIYSRRLQHLFDSMVLISVGIALPMTFLSNWIIVTFFGTAFKDAGPVLSIHIWASVFVFLGVASSKWFIIENLQKLTLTRTIWGAVANVAMNLVLIPKYGALGAAWATLISQAVASVFFNAFNKETRQLFRKQVKSFLMPSLWNVLLKKTNP